MAYTDLTQIQEKINTHKSNLAANLAAKSVNANSSETLAVLIGKVKDIEQTGGGGSGEGGLDWSQITDMSYAFYNAPKMFNFLWPTIKNVSHVTSWNYAFYAVIKSTQANKIFQDSNIRFDKLDTYMFQNCDYLTGISLTDSITTPKNSISNCFSGCTRLKLPVAIKVLDCLDKTVDTNLSYAFSDCGSLSNYDGDDVIGDLTVNSSTMSNIFNGCSNIKSIGNITSLSSNDFVIGGGFSGCNYMEEIGVIKANSFGAGNGNIFGSCSRLVKINGFEIVNQITEILTNSGTKMLGTGALSKLEEALNMPIAYHRYGGTNLGSLTGTASARKPLRRLTFCNSENGYLNKTYAKNLDIKYCSFDRDGMLEVFNTIPDASDINATSTITITGNPCARDGTLTEEDIAIATAKGYVVTTA